ncbi:MAG: glucuronate isomerase [Candidatus Omnitrophica bacterium]|nr:glucuronate isomerase [Candidatus Omnitrophota bacterium]
MPRHFMDEDFLLETETSKKLYHDHAAQMPIYDYHCHLPTEQIAEDKTFDNLTQIWLYGDHYKWRAMRANGVDEKFCTGDASDQEKFRQWARTVPYTIRNPLYHWTHLELKRYFGIEGRLLNPQTGEEIYQECSEKLKTPEFSVKNLMRKMKVKIACTTNDPLEDLASHKALAEDGFEIKVLPTFRPDKAISALNSKAYNDYLDRLSQTADIDIKDYASLVQALKQRIEYFHSRGCRISDYGIDIVYTGEFRDKDIEKIFSNIRSNKEVDFADVKKLELALMIACGRIYAEKDWTQQIHLGTMRDTNTRMFEKLGSDTGFDTISDLEVGRPLAFLFDKLDQTGQLPRTIIYNLNPRDNELMAAMTGNFMDGKTPGKIQFGSGWWFLDQKKGMEDQMNALSALGLLSRFIGMLTDSRSFLSYPRHEYFRRILCNLLGRDIENGQIPNDLGLVGGIVKDICYNNAKNYFNIL